MRRPVARKIFYFLFKSCGIFREPRFIIVAGCFLEFLRIVKPSCLVENSENGRFFFSVTVRFK